MHRRQLCSIGVVVTYDNILKGGEGRENYGLYSLLLRMKFIRTPILKFGHIFRTFWMLESPFLT